MSTTKRIEFDYMRAWDEVAKPAYDSLAPQLKALYERVCRECAEYNQDSHLLMPWIGDLRDAFEQFRSVMLGRATRAIYYYGHLAYTLWRAKLLTPHPEAPATEQLYTWKYMADRYIQMWDQTEQGVPEPERIRYGPDSPSGHWKFANYADQVLCDRLGVDPRIHEDPPQSQLYFFVDRGWLVASWQSRNSIRMDLGPCPEIEAYQATIKEIPDCPVYMTSGEWVDVLKEHFERVRAQLTAEEDRPWINMMDTFVCEVDR